MHITFESVLVLFTKSYQNYCTLVKTTACQSWRVFLRHRVYLYPRFSDDRLYVDACLVACVVALNQ